MDELLSRLTKAGAVGDPKLLVTMAAMSSIGRVLPEVCPQSVQSAELLCFSQQRAPYTRPSFICLFRCLLHQLRRQPALCLGRFCGQRCLCQESAHRQNQAEDGVKLRRTSKSRLMPSRFVIHNRATWACHAACICTQTLHTLATRATWKNLSCRPWLVLACQTVTHSRPFLQRSVRSQPHS